jgi:hypothetical protein
MADDKAKIDWKMLEAAATEPEQAELAQAEPPHVEPAQAEPRQVERRAAEHRPAEHRPADPGGKIVFYCSNGHRIVVAAKMGGQRGKCSKCGVAVRIPFTSEPAGQPHLPTAGHGGGAEGDAAGEPATPEENVPAAAADQRPGSSVSQQAAEHEDTHAVGQSVPRDDMFSGLVTASDSQVSATDFIGYSTQPPLANAARPDPDKGGPDATGNPTAALVARLFQEMEHGGVVEVHITGGSVILPEFYEPRWSAGSHGLFASRAADGTVTLTAVAWDSIQKIIVRQVEGLPDGMFE